MITNDRKLEVKPNVSCMKYKKKVEIPSVSMHYLVIKNPSALKCLNSVK